MYTSSAYIHLCVVSAVLVLRYLYNKGSLIPLLLQKSPKFSYLSECIGNLLKGYFA